MVYKQYGGHRLQSLVFDLFTKPIGLLYNGAAEEIKSSINGKPVIDLHTHSSTAYDEGVSPLASEIYCADARGLAGLASTPHQSLRCLPLLIREAEAAEAGLKLKHGSDYQFYFIPGKETSNRLGKGFSKRGHVSSIFFVKGGYTKELVNNIVWFSESKLSDLSATLPEMLRAQEELNNGEYSGLRGVKVIVYPTHVNSFNGFKGCLKNEVKKGGLDDLIAVHCNFLNRDDLRFYKDRDINLIGGSDAHDKYKIGSSRTVFDSEVNDLFDAFYAIKHGKVHVEQLPGQGSVKYYFLSGLRCFTPQWWPKVLGLVIKGLAKMPRALLKPFQ
ncbi:hypothetical protein GF352_03085 [archaeon]|nr:hypothetical protein [archaeon]